MTLHKMPLFVWSNKCKFGQGFGMTETVAVICLMTPEEHIRAIEEKPDLLKSCGHYK